MDVRLEHRAEGLVLRVRLTPGELAALSSGRLVRSHLDEAIDLVTVMADLHDSPGVKTKLARVEMNVTGEGNVTSRDW